jgi:hypothetical protein
MISNLYRGLRGCSSASCFHDLLSSTFGVAGMISDSAERKEKGVGSSMLTADSNGAGVEFRDDLALLAIEIRATFNIEARTSAPARGTETLGLLSGSKPFSSIDIDICCDVGVGVAICNNETNPKLYCSQLALNASFCFVCVTLLVSILNVGC